MHRCVIFFLFLFLFLEVSVAQEISKDEPVEYGVRKKQGWIGFDFGNDVIGVNSFSKDNHVAIFHSFGLKYRLKNPKEGPSFYISESFEGVTDIDRMFNHLKTTIGTDVEIGGRFYFVLGLAGCFKVFVMDSGYRSNFYNFSAGFKFNSGFGYKLSPKFIVDVLCHFQLGSPLYVNNYTSSGGANYSVAEKETQLYFQLGINYLLRKK